MSKGWRHEDGVFEIWNEARTVFTTDGRLLQFLPDAEVFSFNASYPDVPKANIFSWSYEAEWSPPGAPLDFGWVSRGTCSVGAGAQKWTSTIDLGAAPAGANIFLGRVKLTRTTAPTHTWIGETIAAPPINGLWVQVNGSMILEEAVGFGRALSVYIATGDEGREGPSGHLVAMLDQSCSGQCGGIRQWGNQSPVATGDQTGGENRWYGSGATGIPVWSPTSSPGAKSTLGTGNWTGPGGTGSLASNWDRHRWTGDDPAVYSDPTNYSSVYAVEIEGRFGRHA